MTRYRDWQSRLAALLAERRHAPFAWGLNDCCIFACDCVYAMTGHDPADGMRAHRTAQQAAEMVREAGGIDALASERLGTEIPPLCASVGDIGYAECSPGRWGLVVCTGEHWTGPGENGLIFLPMKSAVRAWRAV